MRHPLTAASAALVVTGSALLLIGHNGSAHPHPADAPTASAAAEMRPTGSPGIALPSHAPTAVEPATPTAHAAPPGGFVGEPGRQIPVNHDVTGGLCAWRMSVKVGVSLSGQSLRAGCG